MFSQETSPLGGPYGNMRGPGMGGPPSARTGYDSFSYGNQVSEVCRCGACCGCVVAHSLPIVVILSHRAHDPRPETIPVASRRRASRTLAA